MHVLKRMFLPILIVTIISLSVFLFFKPFFDSGNTSDFTAQVLAAMLGTIMTISITAVLLQAQSASEENKEKSLGVFQYKLNAYSEFLDTFWSIAEDSKITKQEIRKLVHSSIKVSLLSGTVLSSRVKDFVEQCIVLKKFNQTQMTEEDISRFIEYNNSDYEVEIDKKSWDNEFVDIGMIISLMREDLGEDNISNEDAAWESGLNYNSLIDRMFSNNSA